jgi:secondary thiamine-phosphate synthase enzyme
MVQARNYSRNGLKNKDNSDIFLHRQQQTMRGAVHEFSVQTKRRIEMIDITSEVAAAVRQSGTQTGIAVVFVPHTTAAVTINENADPDVPADIMAKLSDLVPECGAWRHVEGNSDAHLKSSIVGASATVIVEGGGLVLGTWQSLFFCEFDGPRSRRVYVTVIKAD